MPHSDSLPPHASKHGNRRVPGSLTRFRGFFARLWCALREIGEIMRPTRFSILVVLAGAALLLFNAQGREIAVGLVDAPVFWAGIAFHLCVFLWAFESWYWARLMIEMVHGADRTRDPDGRMYRSHEAWVKQHGPRIIAASAYVVAGVALLFAHAWGHLIAVVIAGALFYGLLVKRVALVQKLRGNQASLTSAPADSQLADFIGDPRRNASSLHDLPPLSKTILAASVALSVLATIWVFVDAVSFGWALGSAAVAFLGFALIVPGGSVLVYWSRFGGTKGRALGAKGYPVVASLLLWALIVGAFVDNHAVRATGPLPETRPTLAEAALQWHAQAVKVSGSDQPPLVMVATAGGGIRAAYWTATVLGRLQDENPKFRNYLFGVSGVSGGSVGSTVFVTLLADGTAGLDSSVCRNEDDDPGTGDFTRKSYECAGQEVLGRDFLAPTVAALLFPDLMQRFFPLSWFPDRAQALEQGWERSWAKVGLAETTWTDRTFSELWSRDPEAAYLPALLLNGTHVESGKRIITSNLKIDGANFRDAYDYYGLASGDLLPSTAAHNSARFTYVSPAGTLMRDDEAVGHIVDGGYFENFGAVTAQEMLTAVVAALQAEGKKVRPVLIQISNEPALGDDDLEVDRLDPPLDRDVAGWANETLSPLRALLNTRNARGVLAYKQFMLAVNDTGRRAHFRLCTVPGYADPALGWVLAPGSKKRMQELIRSDECGAKTAFGKVLAAIE
jgi:hypothetical protein